MACLGAVGAQRDGDKCVVYLSEDGGDTEEGDGRKQKRKGEERETEREADGARGRNVEVCSESVHRWRNDVTS